MKPQRRRPKAGRGWEQIQSGSGPGYWVRDHLGVGVSVDKIDDHREHHVSISCAKRHPTDADVAMVRRDFGMQRAEEDNSASLGVARHLWLKVEEL